MNGYIFDWDENSEKILNGEGYTTVGHQFMEQVALFRYLMDHGYTKDDVDKIWRNTNSILYQKTCGDVDEIERLFARIWGKAAKWKNNFKGNEIVIYQSEIDFINNMEVLPWIKQYVLTLLCVYKWWGKERCQYTKEVNTFCYAATNVKRETDYNAIKLSECISKYNPYELFISKVSMFSMTFCVNNGIEIARLRNPRHIETVFSFLKNMKICSVCGCEYEYNSHSIHNSMCSKCYTAKRREDKRLNMIRGRALFKTYNNEKSK